jgi:hypothetical protein
VKLNPELPSQKHHSPVNKRKLVTCYVWTTSSYGAEKWALRKVDQKHLEISEMWCWGRMEKISWTDRVRNEEVLHGVKEDRNILHTANIRQADWIGRILCRDRRKDRSNVKTRKKT